MSWFEQMERRKPLLVGGTIAVCVAMLAVTARRAFYAYDGYWHLQAGLDWLQKGLSPWQDHFSFTFYGDPITGPPWIFQALLGLLVNWFGLEAGFEILRFSSYCLLLGLFVVFLRKLRAPALVYLLVLPLLVVLLQFRVLVRPELLSYSFSIIALMLYYRAGSGLSPANMLPILGLMLLWSNYHTPIFGYVIFFGYFIDMAWKQIRENATGASWFKWLAWGMAIVAVGFLRPGFEHPLLGFLSFSSKWSEHITEYYDFHSYVESTGFYALILVSIITLVLLSCKRQFGLLAVSIIVVASSAIMPRLITPGGIVVMGIFAWTVSEMDMDSVLGRLSSAGRNAIGVLALCLLTLSIASGVHKSRQYMEENEFVNERYPIDVTDYMIDHQISGRIFNEFAVGGYLINRLSPDSQVYIDGRTNILYPVEHLELFLEANQFPDVFRAETEKYDIKLALLLNRLDPFSLVYDSGTLGLDFVGRSFSLFRKNNPNFPELGKLIVQPFCWNQRLAETLEAEHSRARLLLPDESMLLPFGNYVSGYTRATDKRVFLKETDQGEKWDIPTLRFSAYQSLDHGLHKLALERFSGFVKWEFQDYLASAVALVQLGQWTQAERLLDKASRHAWPNMKLADLGIFYNLLKYMREHGSLVLFDDAYLNQLENQVGTAAKRIPLSVPAVSSFCQNKQDSL
jgi:hypothetical protein